MVKTTHHQNKGYQKFEGGGFVGGVAKGFESSYKKRKKDGDEGGKEGGGGSMSGMVPKALHKLWGMIPSAADMAVTGKVSATPEEYDAARERKEREIEAKEK
ncbi:MAG: hypothetical protein ABWY64_09165 [Tardiphaga sp.]